jgi:hypothetical protein
MNTYSRNNDYKETNMTKVGVYEFKCQNCPSIFIGQTGRGFTVRYKEHIQDTKVIKVKLASHSTF